MMKLEQTPIVLATAMVAVSWAGLVLPAWVVSLVCLGVLLAIWRSLGTFLAEYRQLKVLAFHDPLTALSNRACLERKLSFFDHCELVSVIAADLNDLKQVNDTFGHRHGDRLLIQAAQILKGVCREQDLLVRWGGDEFLAILPGISHEQAERVIDRLMLLTEEGQGSAPSIALGCGTKDLSRSIYQAIEEAEARMYKQKLRMKQRGVSRFHARRAGSQREEPADAGFISSIAEG